MSEKLTQVKIEKLNLSISKFEEKLAKLQDLNDNHGKFYDKKLRVTKAKINLLKANVEYLSNHLNDENNNKVALKRYCLSQRIDLQTAKKSRNIRYVKAEMVDSEKEKLMLNIHKNEVKIDTLKDKYQKLVLQKQVGKKIRIEKIVKISKKIEKLITKNKRNHINYELCDTLQYEVMNLPQKLKHSFAQIEYNKQKTIWGLIFLIPFFLGICVFFIPSVIKTFYWSFYEVLGGKGGLTFTPKGFKNYIYLFQEYTIHSNMIFKISILDFFKSLALDLPIILIFSLIIAVLLNTKFKGSLFVKAVFFIPVVFNFTLVSSSISSGMGAIMEENMNGNMMLVENLTKYLMKINIGEGLIEFIIGAVDKIFTIVNLSGIQILVFTAALQAIPTNLYEAAKVEGCNKYEVFWKITFPMVSPMLLTCAVYTVVDAFVRSPIFEFLKVSQTTGSANFGLTSAIAVSFLVINLGVIGLVFILLKGLVFYYDKR